MNKDLSIVVESIMVDWSIIGKRQSWEKAQTGKDWEGAKNILGVRFHQGGKAINNIFYTFLQTSLLSFNFSDL